MLRAKKSKFVIRIKTPKDKRIERASQIKKIKESNLPSDQKYKEIEKFRQKHKGTPYEYKGANEQ